MKDNFHSIDCALRHNGYDCTCGYEKPLTKLERAFSDAQNIFAFMNDNGDILEISTASQMAIKKWQKKYK